jgi:hypothetical protein
MVAHHSGGQHQGGVTAATPRRDRGCRCLRQQSNATVVADPSDMTEAGQQEAANEDDVAFAPDA